MFQFVASETWHLVSQGGMVDGPPPRHRHSAVLHNNALWVFGGMTDLQERSDFWRFDFGNICKFTDGNISKRAVVSNLSVSCHAM